MATVNFQFRMEALLTAVTHSSACRVDPRDRLLSAVLVRNGNDSQDVLLENGTLAITNHGKVQAVDVEILGGVGSVTGVGSELIATGGVLIGGDIGELQRWKSDGRSVVHRRQLRLLGGYNESGILTISNGGLLTVGSAGARIGAISGQRGTVVVNAVLGITQVHLISAQ